jgi:four helix bundle protein
VAKESRVESRESGEAIRSYRDLVAWQKAMALLVSVYAQTEQFPKHELYGLSQQLRRAVVSVPSNIAEGSSRRSTQEFLRYLNIASGSLAEVETQISAARMLDYVSLEQEKNLLTQSDEVSRIIQGLYNALQTKITRLSTLDSNH